MIALYYCGTPNGHKLTLCLEELGLPYRIIAVDVGKGEQFKPEYLAISPNNKIPALIDRDPADGGPPVDSDRWPGRPGTFGRMRPSRCRMRSIATRARRRACTAC